MAYPLTPSPPPSFSPSTPTPHPPQRPSLSALLPRNSCRRDSVTYACMHARGRTNSRLPARSSAVRSIDRSTMQLIFPSYDRLNEAGLLGKKPPTKPNFFAARILADEALASKVRPACSRGEEAGKWVF